MSQDQFNGSRHADNVIAGEVVRADESGADESKSSLPEPQQTFLHKVASARPASYATPWETPSEEPTIPNPIAGNSPATPDSRVEDVQDDVPAGEPDQAMPADAAVADSDTADSDTTALNTAGTDTARPDMTDSDTTDSDTIGMDAARSDMTDTTDSHAMAPEPDVDTPDAPEAVALPDEQSGRHRADQPASEPEPTPTVPRGRRPGDVTLPPDIEGNLLGDVAGLRERWMRVQAQFVDDPRAAVSDAAGFITAVMAQLEAAVQERQRMMRDRWDGDGQADTETLRVMMQRYRALLERLAEV